MQESRELFQDVIEQQKNEEETVTGNQEESLKSTPKKRKTQK